MNNLLHAIHTALENIPNATDPAAPFRHLFLKHLGWSAPGPAPSVPIRAPAPLNATLHLAPVAQLGGLPVFHLPWPEATLPTLTARRAVHRALAPNFIEHLLCYTSADRRQIAFTWARRRPDGKIELRTLPYEVGSPARTTVERLALLSFSLQELDRYPDATPPSTAVIDKLDTAFSVEAVTHEFFEDYKKVFADLQSRLTQATRDKAWAHDYALQLLNRLMFLYFIQRKRWISNNPRFLADFWQAYKASGQPKDSFFENWLSVLFFEAFNKKFHGGHRHFPQNIFSALMAAPYLNGGLFTQNKLDDAYNPKLSDDFFAILFDNFDGTTPGFFERYNFTIAESTPLDIEVAVDPEMIGKVY
ncbi:MAG: hypothetical protein RML49_06435, partial [Verrucomicrobiae bacterium]|nr:hypothetical protein [Verrucomicrobiae bacterium]